MCKCWNSNFPIIISVSEKKTKQRRRKTSRTNNATIEIEFLNEHRRKKFYDERSFHSFEIFLCLLCYFWCAWHFWIINNSYFQFMSSFCFFLNAAWYAPRENLKTYWISNHLFLQKVFNIFLGDSLGYFKYMQKKSGTSTINQVYFNYFMSTLKLLSSKKN